MKLIPAPQKFIIDKNTVKLKSEFSISCDIKVEKQIELLKRRIANLFIIKNDVAKTAYIVFCENVLPHENMYTIKLDETAIRVMYNSYEAVGYACVTLYHLLIQAFENENCLNKFYIEDYPKYKHRGVHLDTARHFFAISELEKLIESFSLFKINILHWHFADDQAWRLEIKSYPKLVGSCENNYYTQKDAKQLVAYAKERGINIIPEVEIPGHSSAAIAAYPELSCREKQIQIPTTGGIFYDILCSGKPQTYKFISLVLKEVCSVFEYELIHLGGDEAPKSMWEKCPRCNEKAKELGIDDFELMQGYMLNFAYEIIEKYGKRAICWNDCLKSKNLSSRIAIQYWRPFGVCKKNIYYDRDFVFSNIHPFYFDYPYSFNALKNVYSFKPKALCLKIDDKNILGAECTAWAERIEDNERLEFVLFPRCVAFAENVWSNSLNFSDFIDRLEYFYHYFEQSKINAAPLKIAQVKGVERLWENIKFFKMLIGQIRLQKKTKKKEKI